jgi:dTDP-4-amino-4,6-dideoxygalactose transaminase
MFNNETGNGYLIGDRRVFLSPPHMGGEEILFVQDAFKSNYIAPLGPQVDAFEREFCDYTGFRHAVAVSSGTAAMHLALYNLGIEPGDEVFASTLTFIGSVSPVTFLGAMPVFIDCDRETWNMDPELLETELKRSEKRGKLPKAVVPTDLYGQCCNLTKIVELCDRYGVPVVCDSAEAMGAWYLGRAKDGNSMLRSSSERSGRPSSIGTWRHAGRDAKAAVFSFNGNKIMTTSGGGMLASDDDAFVERVRFLSQQAREKAPHYEHTEIGFNYRMSNILAAIGRGQLRCLNERIGKREEINTYYQKKFGPIPGISFMPEASYVRSNKWLSVIIVSPDEFGANREDIRRVLEAENIEARPVWKPMHLQPVFWNISGGKSTVDKKRHYPCRVVGGDVSEELFARGLCLPSGSAMTLGDLERIVDILLNTLTRERIRRES